MSLPEGSWGAEDHSVWETDQSTWMWEVIHRCERQYLDMEQRYRYNRTKVVFLIACLWRLDF